jgi:hypothetical protein
MKLNKILTCALPLAVIAFSCHAGAAVVYLEDFNQGTGNRTLADFGLSGVDAGGTTITTVGSFNNGTVYASTTLEGSSYASLSNDWVWMDAPQLSTVTQVRWLDTAEALGYRVGFEVGGVWYLSSSLSTSTAGGFSFDGTGNGSNPVPNGDGSAVDGPFPGITVTDFSSGFAAWGLGTSTTGAPVDDTEAWDLTTLGTAGALPTGTITRIGLMAESGSHRPDYFEVSGTAAIPEPTTTALLGLGGLALILRRRK